MRCEVTTRGIQNDVTKNRKKNERKENDRELQDGEREGMKITKEMGKNVKFFREFNGWRVGERRT